DDDDFDAARDGHAERAAGYARKRRALCNGARAPRFLERRRVGDEGVGKKEGRVIALRRPRRRVERVVVAALAAAALSLLVGYLATLVHLVVRGGKHLVAFSPDPVPLAGSEGEEGMRMALAGAICASFAWALLSLTRPLVASFVPRWEAMSRVRLAVVGAVALASALTLSDHLPPFLISLPKETEAGGGIGPQLFNTI